MSSHQPLYSTTSFSFCKQKFCTFFVFLQFMVFRISLLFHHKLNTNSKYDIDISNETTPSGGHLIISPLLIYFFRFFITPPRKAANSLLAAFLLSKNAVKLLQITQMPTSYFLPVLFFKAYACGYAFYRTRRRTKME